MGPMEFCRFLDWYATRRNLSRSADNVIADSFNINTWMISSSMITSYGLSWWQSWICVWLGYFIAACFVCLTGRMCATYHIGTYVFAV